MVERNGRNGASMRSRFKFLSLIGKLLRLLHFLLNLSSQDNIRLDSLSEVKIPDLNL